MNWLQRIGLGALMLSAVPGCGPAETDVATPSAVAERRAADDALPRVIASSEPDGQEALYQESMALFTERGRQHNAAFVRDMALSEPAAKAVLAILETELQAKVEISGYLRQHRGLGPQELREAAKQPGAEALARWLDDASPGTVRNAIAEALGEEGYQRYAELRRERAGRRATIVEDQAGTVTTEGSY